MLKNLCYGLAQWKRFLTGASEMASCNIQACPVPLLGMQAVDFLRLQADHVQSALVIIADRVSGRAHFYLIEAYRCGIAAGEARFPHDAKLFGNTY